ncbi:MAG: efflux RND transporter periplasmic adaptor subunit [Verrucomicrobiota bacterium]|jgi:RND family efflux transporter MFP subunit
MSTNTEPLDPQPPAGGPIQEQPAKPPRPFSSRIAGCLQQLRGRVATLLRRLDWRIVGMVVLAVTAIAVWRAIAAHAKPPAAAAHAVAVAVARVTREDLCNRVTIPAEFRPYMEVELHAKVSGYVREMKVDFGDRVKSNQLLATLEVPELHDELHNAIATEQKAEADYTNAHLIYLRLAAVNKEHPNLVAQQDLDTAEAKDLTTAAAIAATKADVAKFNTLVAYTFITAPFDGVITKRYADPGALIQAGTASDTQALPLVRVSDNYRLRLDFFVSQKYVKDTHVGDPVEVRVESLGGKNFTGIITRTTERVEEQTRKLTVEIEVPNPSLELVPGTYAAVVLKVESRPHALAIPTEAVPTGQQSSVYVVNDKDEIEERPVTLGLETPTRYEVTAGLKEGDLVLIGRRSKVKPGQKVEPKLITPLALP